MERVIRSALVIFAGGLLMLFGVYFSFLFRSAVVMVFIGAVIFLYGLYLDLRRRR